MADSSEILADLDKHAEAFEFPGFNNMNYDTADARLRAYSDGKRWALLVEMVVDWPAAEGLMTLLFGFGNALDGDGGLVGDISPVSLGTEDDDEVEDSDENVAADEDEDEDEGDEDEDEDEEEEEEEEEEDEDEDEDDDDEEEEEDEEEDEEEIPESVRLRGKTITVNRDRVAKRAEEHDLAPTFSLLLDLLATNRDDLFHTPEELAEAEVIPADLPLVLQLDEWHHPNVYGETKPSQSEVFRQLAEVLATGNRAAYKPTEKPNNRDWKRWIDK